MRSMVVYRSVKEDNITVKFQQNSCIRIDFAPLSKSHSQCQIHKSFNEIIKQKFPHYLFIPHWNYLLKRTTQIERILIRSTWEIVVSEWWGSVIKDLCCSNKIVNFHRSSAWCIRSVLKNEFYLLNTRINYIKLPTNKKLMCMVYTWTGSIYFPDI